jgi:hypothetical protein
VAGTERSTKRRLLALAAIGAIVAGCAIGRTVLPTANPSMSLALQNRIAEIGQGQDWYGVVHRQLNGRPDAIRVGPPDCWCYVQVVLDPGVDPGSPIAVHACEAIAAAVNSPQYGTSLQVTEVELINNDRSYDCNPPADTMPS